MLYKIEKLPEAGKSSWASTQSMNGLFDILYRLSSFTVQRLADPSKNKIQFSINLPGK